VIILPSLSDAAGSRGRNTPSWQRNCPPPYAAVSSGDLWLRLDEPARALRAFDSYLSDVRTGPLREEALFGRARCLKTLGDEAAEAETWARLLEDFPGSAYGPAARQRLNELRGAR
jgi:hypothetical protein